MSETSAQFKKGLLRHAKPSARGPPCAFRASIAVWPRCGDNGGSEPTSHVSWIVRGAALCVSGSRDRTSARAWLSM